jgi:hypothetical protein
MATEKRYNNVLSIIDERLIPNEAAKKARGEVFTPLTLVREMLFGLRKSALAAGRTEIWGVDATGKCVDAVEADRVGGIPLEVWRDPTKKWLDPANGIGNFPVVTFYMLDYQLGEHGPAALLGDANKKKRREHIVENMLYMIEINKGNVNTSRKIFEQMVPGTTANICCADSLTITDATLLDIFRVNRFDVVMGNPPFNPPKTETGSSGNNIWANFVMKSFHILNENGFLSLVHPPGWKKPTDELFRLERFVGGNYTGQIRQGQVWQVLKDSGVFNFIYTNDQRSKTLAREYLEHFPAVDYYVYHKSGKSLQCDTKNIFLGENLSATNVRLNYNLTYLPNLITPQTQDILHKITSKEGDKLHFKTGFDPRGFHSKEPGPIKYMYQANKSGPVYQYYKENNDNVNISKIVINYGGGIDGFYCSYIDKDDTIGVLHMTMYDTVSSSKEGKRLVNFFNSDIVKFIFLITQYSIPPNTKNEPLVANSITIPPEGVDDYYAYFGITQHKKYIETALAHYEAFKAPKRRTTTARKKKTATAAAEGGARRSKYGKTRKIRRS